MNVFKLSVPCCFVALRKATHSGCKTCHQHIQQCSSVLWKYMYQADYISVHSEGLSYVCLLWKWLEWGIVWALCRTSESGAFLRCNLLCPDERPTHNGPSPAYEASMEHVCSLEGDYNGFTTDLTHSFATPLNPRHLHLPKVSLHVCCSQLSPALL